MIVHYLRAAGAIAAAEARRIAAARRAPRCDDPHRRLL
jgi:hypothetical protein